MPCDQSSSTPWSHGRLPVLDPMQALAVTTHHGPAPECPNSHPRKLCPQGRSTSKLPTAGNRFLLCNYHPSEPQSGNGSAQGFMAGLSSLITPGSRSVARIPLPTIIYVLAGGVGERVDPSSTTPSTSTLGHSRQAPRRPTQCMGGHVTAPAACTSNAFNGTLNLSCRRTRTS